MVVCLARPYEREKKLAVSFVFCTAGLFLLGGLFDYFIAFACSLPAAQNLAGQIHFVRNSSKIHFFMHPAKPFGPAAEKSLRA
jgi:Sec-independent protein secretion pathway component TatC